MLSSQRSREKYLGGCKFSRQRAEDEIAQLRLEVVRDAAEFPLLQKAMGKIANDESRRVAIAIAIKFAAGFGKSLFLPFQKRRRKERRVVLRLLV